MEQKLLNFSKVQRFDDLSRCVQYCSICPEMCHRFKVLSRENGSINSKVLFLAEAPGRLGADRTGIPLYGDRTGDNFENLLGAVGWKREDIFISNAVLCNPRTDNGNNRTPDNEEVKNCSTYLEMLLNLIRPEVIVTLGRIALNSLSFIFPHNISLSDNVASPINWQSFKIFPLYHPGPRAVLHRSFAKQTQDFIELSKIVNPLTGIKQKRTKNKVTFPYKEVNFSNLEKIILIILMISKEITYFKLHKLLYLIDLRSIQEFGYSLTQSVYKRQTEGPWIPTLVKIIDGLKSYLLWNTRNKIPFVKLTYNPELFLLELESQEIELIIEVINNYSQMSNAAIKTAVYRTKPMQDILTEEKKGNKMLNTTIIDKNGIKIG